jgi:putative sigma-54 modulation protein
MKPMRLELTARHITITPAIRKLVDERLQHTLRFLNDSAVSAQVVLTKEKTRYHADVTLHARGEHFMHGAATGRDLPTALSAAVDKIDRQGQRLKGKWRDHKRRGISGAKALADAAPAERGAKQLGSARAASDESRRGGGSGDRDAQQVRVIRARRYEVKPMSVDEAALRVGAGTEAFLVFRNDTTDAVNVLFRRPDGNLGLIEPEA